MPKVPDGISAVNGMSRQDDDDDDEEEGEEN